MSLFTKCWSPKKSHPIWRKCRWHWWTAANSSKNINTYQLSTLSPAHLAVSLADFYFEWLFLCCQIGFLAAVRMQFPVLQDNYECIGWVTNALNGVFGLAGKLRIEYIDRNEAGAAASDIILKPPPPQKASIPCNQSPNSLKSWILLLALKKNEQATSNSF